MYLIRSFSLDLFSLNKRHETIGSALGCTNAYLEGLDPNLFLETCPKLQLISTVATCEKRADQSEKGT